MERDLNVCGKNGGSVDDYNKMIDKTYEEYKQEITAGSDEEQMIRVATDIYQKVDDLNIKYNKRCRSDVVDDENVYYTICRITESEYGGRFLQGTKEEKESKKKSLAEKLASSIIDRRRISVVEPRHNDALGPTKILVIEPHHDDALGSASGILFNNNSEVTVYTLTKSNDLRDEVDLTDIKSAAILVHLLSEINDLGNKSGATIKEKNIVLGNIFSELYDLYDNDRLTSDDANSDDVKKEQILRRVLPKIDELRVERQRLHGISTNRSTSVKRHIKCDLEDYHYDDRYEASNSNDIDYKQLVEYYTKNDPSKNNIVNKISDIIDEEADKHDLIFIPLGILHPMHILTAYYAFKKVVEKKCVEKVIFYVDHPYDLQVDYKRISQAVRYYEGLVDSPENFRLVRMDDRSIDQSDVGVLLKEIYGSKHYGEFAGTLEKTYCSYFVSANISNEIIKKYRLHKNNVLFVTYQAKPFSKTGGLGEVAYTYSNALRRYVNDVAIVTPKHKGVFNENSVITEVDGKYYAVKYDEDGEPEIGNEIVAYSDDMIELIDYTSVENKDFAIDLGGEDKDCRIEKYRWHGVYYYLIDVKKYFKDSNIFDNDNVLNEIAAFSLAFLKSLEGVLDFAPTVIHCNDYQTALIPFLIKTKDKHRFEKLNLRTLYTIHYYGYRGIFPKSKLFKLLNFEDRECTECMICRRDTNKNCIFRKVSAYSKEQIEELGINDDSVSLMKIGIKYADIVSTVSPGYAEQIKNYPDFQGVANVYGIRNGVTISSSVLENSQYENLLKIDVNSKDYVEELKEAKKNNKKLLQKDLQLNTEERVPLICMVSRLNSVKGLDDVKVIFDHLMKCNLQLVIIGNDDKVSKILRPDKETNSDVNIGNEKKEERELFFEPFKDFFEKKAEQYKGKFAYLPFTEEWEYKAYSASDFLLMPSKDEACGTTQILAMKHGVIPIVTMIPAFFDTVVDYAKVESDKNNDDYVVKPSDNKGVGFYAYKDDCWVLLEVIKKAIQFYQDDEKKWNQIVNSTQPVDFSWDNGSIVQYLHIYNDLQK